MQNVFTNEWRSGDARRRARLLAQVAQRPDQTFEIFESFKFDGIRRVWIQLGANYNPIVPPDKYTLVVLVDASPKVVVHLKKRFLHNKLVRVIHTAISNRSGTIDFHDNENSEASSLLRPSESVAWSGKYRTVFKLPTMRLEDLLRAIPVHLTIELLQTNIEGFDLLALKTSGQALQRVQLIISEMDVNGYLLYGAGIQNQVRDFEQFLPAQNFEMVACTQAAASIRAVRNRHVGNHSPWIITDSLGMTIENALDLASLRLGTYYASKWVHCSYRNKALALPVARSRRVGFCVENYANTLSSIVAKLPTQFQPVLKNTAKQLLAWKHRVAFSSTRSPRRVVLGAGFSSTGTDVIAAALRRFGLTSWRATEEYKGRVSLHDETLTPDAFRRPLVEAWAKGANCNLLLNRFNYDLPQGVDAYLDRPSAEAFLDFWWNQPHAKVILSSRAPHNWAQHRSQHYRVINAPIARPCGINVHHLSTSVNSLLFAKHAAMVKCVVRPADLFEIKCLDIPGKFAPVPCKTPMNDYTDALEKCSDGSMLFSPASGCWLNTTATALLSNLQGFLEEGD